MLWSVHRAGGMRGDTSQGRTSTNMELATVRHHSLTSRRLRPGCHTKGARGLYSRPLPW